jgi:hypothetical protein
MLSTAQALKEWERVLKLLTEIKVHVVAHPDTRTLPASLDRRRTESRLAVSKQLASPVATWKHLLKTKVGNTCSHLCFRYIGKAGVTAMHCIDICAVWVN